MKSALVLLSLLATPAFAEPTQTPSQIAIQIDNVINGWAQELERREKTIFELQKEIADLKAKYEPEKKNAK